MICPYCHVVCDHQQFYKNCDICLENKKFVNYCRICNFIVCRDCYDSGLYKCKKCFKFGHQTERCPHIFPWDCARLIFIGNKEKDCLFNKLPREMIREIFKYLKYVPFQDIENILASYALNKNIARANFLLTCRKNISMRFYMKFKEILIHKKGEVYEFIFKAPEISDEEIMIIRSYGLKIENLYDLI